MPDFEGIASIRGPRLADLSEHVLNVLALNLELADEYVVSELALAEYDFAPYALSGLAAAMRTPSSADVRPTTVVTVPLADDQGGHAAVEQRVTLYGPGDVLGVDPAQVVRRYPAPGSTTAEETFHAHVEFDRPELPWAFSAATPGDRMLPWLTLVVLEASEVEWEPASMGFQPVLAVDADRLPPLDSAWAWAHVQASGGSASLSARLSTAYASVNVSRLLGARVLTQNTGYVACVVPTTEVGRNAGLGLTGGTLGPAWTAGSGRVRLPAYDRWEFRTAPDGDFARLARRLVGVPAPWAIGRRIMDASRPGEPFSELAADEDGRRQVIKCALFSPASAPPGAPADDANWSEDRVEELRVALERASVIEGTAASAPGDAPDLPIVGPRVYARAQRGVGTIPAGDWFADLNLAPRHRVVAGLGTRVVAKDQEPLMQAAWAQVGAVEKANRELALAELARNLATTLHHRMELLDTGRLLQMVGPVAPRVRLDGAELTVEGQVARSSLPTAALGGAMRRVQRVTGPMARSLDAAGKTAFAQLVASGDGARDFRQPISRIDGVAGLSEKAIAALDPSVIGVALRQSPDQALETLKQSNRMLIDGQSLATAVTTPSVWKQPDRSFEPARQLAERLGAELVLNLPTHARDDVVLARSRSGLLAGLAVSDVGTPTLDVAGIVVDLSSGIQDVLAAEPVTGRGPVVVAGRPTRTSAGTMMREGAVGTTGTTSHVPSVMRTSRPNPTVRMGSVSADTVFVPIVRPTRTVDPSAVQLTDRQRIDALRTAQGTMLSTWMDRAKDVSVLDVRAAVATTFDYAGVLELAVTPTLGALEVTRGELLQRLRPDRTVVDSARARIELGSLTFDPFVEVIRPIMAAPRFDRPMYQALHSYDREWLVPGLSTLPQSEMVTLLSANDEFSEAFLIGLSDEMGRELLWRQYPTDARGTYFRRFWSPTHDELTQEIHRFAHTGLGRHVSTGPTGQSGRAVVVIRGEVVRRYPDLTVMAMHDHGLQGGLPLLPENPTGLPEAAPSLFHAMLPPDVMMAGLDISVDELRRPGWWIVLGEHPQATRFRRTESDLLGHEVRFCSPNAAHGAAVAADRLENPTRIAFEAGDFLPPGS